MISEEDLTQDPSCFITDNCSTTYCHNAVVKLPEIVISNATGNGNGAPYRQRGGSDGAVTTSNCATTAPSLCYVKLNSSPLIRRHYKPPLVAISSRSTGGSSGPATADTTTGDSLDLFTSTEYDNGSCTNSTLLLVNNDEMTKCIDQSSAEEIDNSDMAALQESASLTSLVLNEPNRTIAADSVNSFESKYVHRPSRFQTHGNQEEEAADNRSDKSKIIEREARNNLVEIRSRGVGGLPLSAQVSSTTATGDATDLTSDHSRSESTIIAHKPIKYSAADVNPIKHMATDGQCRVKPETHSGLSASCDNLTGEVTGKINRLQELDHHQVASSYETPDNVELSRSSDIALDTRRTCLKTMATATTMMAADEYTGSSEATSNRHKINTVNDVSRNKAHRAKLTKRRQRAQNRNKIIVSQEKRAAKTLGIIMGCFVVCWLPFFIVAVLRPFYPVPPVVTEIITWLGYFNSLINPGIYTFFNQDFRRAFYKIITCRMCRQDSLYI